MSKIVLLAVLAAWAAVLIPPLLRSRVENRPNSSVTDFRRQLSTLQRAVPTRTMVPMRSIGRGLAPSPLSRPVAPGRPGQMHRTAAPTVAGQRMHAVTLDRSGQHRQSHLHRVSQRELVRRRRANIFFMLVLVTGVTAFLAATTKANSMVYAFALAFISLCGYCYKLVQIRSLEVDRDSETRWFNAA
jgi:flagellar basal body rod protein FlgF